MYIVLKRRSLPGHLPHTEEEEMHKPFQLENMKGRDHLIDLVVDGRSILKWTLEK
jgi:hypothetical protein